LLAGGSLLVDVDALAQVASPDAVTVPYASGRLIKILPFVGEETFDCGKLWLSGLDGRLYTDLSNLSPKSLITPTENFYVRTSCPDLIDYSKPWTITVTASDGDKRKLPIDRIESMSKDMGVHLMECSGNEKNGQFGLMSACRWHGIPVMDLLKSMKLIPKYQRILISGFDQHSQPSPGIKIRKSEPGASWIFTPEQLQSTGAFLATKMNGAALTKDHGFPVRLVVPGWYGCTCIKWVNSILFTDESAEATSQMKEFADRTHQDGVPQLACDYKAAAIDQAAMPIRVEEWDVDGHKRYNVVGVMWGGHRLTKGLEIRFDPDQSYVPVETCHQTSNSTWTLWSHRWAPASAGVYQIQLKVNDPSVPSRRLDQGYYIRTVRI
jgi:DMSO/TMAO reductase YedYZ molybdopterin-dependent catalytic subunit